MIGMPLQRRCSSTPNFVAAARKLLVQANRNGFFYVLDRVTGEFLLGRTFRQETHLGERHRRGWPPQARARPGTNGAGNQDLPVGRGRDELDVNGL